MLPEEETHQSLLPHCFTSDTRGVGFPHIERFCYTSWASYNLTQFSYYLPGDSVRSHRFRVQSHKFAPLDAPSSEAPIGGLVGVGEGHRMVNSRSGWGCKAAEGTCVLDHRLGPGVARCAQTEAAGSSRSPFLLQCSFSALY